MDRPDSPAAYRLIAKDKSTDTKVLLFRDSLEVEKLDHLKVAYDSMTNIENADESKISAMRVILLGVIGALWKKKHVYTVIQYKDAIGEEQTMVFDFEGDIDKVQPMIYHKMIEARIKAREAAEAAALGKAGVEW
jgi:hypothetical protein